MPNMSLSPLQNRTPSPGLDSVIGTSRSNVTSFSPLETGSVPPCPHSSTIVCDACQTSVHPRKPRVRGPPENPLVGVGHGRKVEEYCTTLLDELEHVGTEEGGLQPLQLDKTDGVYHPKRIVKPANPMTLRPRNKINYQE